MLDDKKDENLVVFLSFGSINNKSVICLSSELNKFDIKLVPVEFDQINVLVKNGKNLIIICETKNFNSKLIMDKLVKSSLGFALRAKLITLFHVTSFGEIEDLTDLKRLQYYIPIKLPATYDCMAEKIYTRFIQLKDSEQAWPGGRRSKLPNIDSV